MPFRVAALVVAGTFAAVLAGRGEAPAPPGEGDWDKGAAAAYLDARMDAWWARAKVLKTGDGEARCLSCHTALPYAMARPALRAAMRQETPTAHEEQILDVARQRVEHRGGPQPYYDHTDAKKAESRGVEAVLNALVLAQHDALRRSGRPSDATRAAIGQLWTAQRPDGAWDWLDFGLEPYEATDAVFHGATLAALAAGTAPGALASRDARGREGIERLTRYLRTHLAAQRLFNRAWALLADAQLEGVLTAGDRDAIVADLERAQHADGGWSTADLGPWRWSKAEAPGAPGATDATLLAASDGYATGLVVHALRRAGMPATRPSVARGVTWLVANQRPVVPNDEAWAPWRAYSLNFDREHGGEKGETWRRMFMSDLATAFAVLALTQ
jgi:squalene-hopene/tetraprenyl-beta-curcumene cyclase